MACSERPRPWTKNQLQAYFDDCPPSLPLPDLFDAALAASKEELLSKAVEVPFPWPEYEALPNKALRDRVKLGDQTMATFEFMGIPGAGKSMIIDYLKAFLADLYPEAEIEIVPDRENPELERFKRNIDRIKPISGLSQLHYLFFLYQTAALMHWRQKLVEKSLAAVGARKAPPLTISLIERGPNDMSIFGGAVWKRLDDLGRQYDGVLRASSSLSFRLGEAGMTAEQLKEYSRFLAQTIGLVPVIDAPILIGIYPETGVIRRWEEKVARPSIISDNRPLVEGMLEGYGFWLGSWAPYLESTYGAGLLVVDNDRDEDKERNLARIGDYCRRVVDRLS